MIKSEFRTLLASWLKRPDLSASVLNAMITRGVARAEKEVRVRSLEEEYREDGLEEALSYIDVPSDLVRVEMLEADGVPLVPISYERFLRERSIWPQSSPASFPGQPRYYARRLNKLYFHPQPQSYVALVYGKRFTALSADAATTELLTDGVDYNEMVLLYACLSYAGDYVRHDETATWEQRYIAEKDRANNVLTDLDAAAPEAVQPLYGSNYS